jgi:hypothetical protein
LRNVEASGNREERKTKEDIDRSREYMDWKASSIANLLDGIGVGKKIDKVEALLARVKAVRRREDVYKRDNLAEEAIDREIAVRELLERVFQDAVKDELWGREWKGREGAAIHNDEA